MYLKNELYELVLADKNVFDFIVEAAFDGLWYWDLEHPENAWMNAKFWTVLGYDPDKMPHQSSAWQNIINQDDLKAANENFTRHCEHPDHPYDQTVRYMHKNGSTVWMRCRGMAIRDKKGKPVRMLGVHHDITKLKQAEENYAISESTYKEIFNGIDDPLIIHEIDTGAILNVNDSMLRKFGYERDDLTGLTIADLSTPNTPYTNELANELIKRASKGEKVIFEWLNKKKNGDLFFSEIILKRVHIAGVERIMAVFRDISKRKKVEEALYASEERFRIAQDTSPDGFTILSPVRNEKGEVVDFTWIYQNRAVGRINGTSPEEVVGKRLLDLFPAHKGTAIFEAYLHVANTGEVKIFEEVYVGEIVSVPTWLRLVIVPMGKDIAILGQNITERKQAEEALSHSHNLMKYIIEHTRSAVAVHDKELRYIYASQRYIDDYKISSGDIIGKHHYEVFPDLPQKWRDVHQRALKGEVLSAEDDPYVREDGSVEWTRWECRPWYEKDESVGGIIIYTEVITERKRTEKELEVFKTISDNSLHGKAIADMNGNLTYVNDYFANIHGFNKEDLIGKNLSVFHNEIQMNEVKRLIGNLIQSGSFAPTEVWHIKSDGTEFPTLMTGVAIKDEIRNTSYLASTLVDITLQKQTQEELFSAKERAEENENKFRAYTEQSPNAIYLTDLNGDCIYVNSKWLEHTGMTYNEAMGKGWINGLYEEDKKKISENWYNSVKSNGKWAFEYRFINKKGEVTWVEGTAKELFNSKGEIAGYLGTNVNITKRKNVENELVLAKERAEESEQRFKALLESAPDGVAVVNA